MIKFIKYLLLGVLAYAVFMVALFPVSMVLDRVELDPFKLNDVSGQFWKGSVAKLEIPNTYLPTGPEVLEVEDINWQLAPVALFRGSGAAEVSFSAFGGDGSGIVAQKLNGSQSINKLLYSVSGEGLSILLDPFVKIGGQVELSIEEALIENQLLKSLRGTLVWQDATLIIPTDARLGQITVDIKPKGEVHIAEVSSNGGDLDIDGEVEMALNGNFKSDITVKTQNTTPTALTDMLRAVARPSSKGTFRFRRSGNINKML